MYLRGRARELSPLAVLSLRPGLKKKTLNSHEAANRNHPEPEDLNRARELSKLRTTKPGYTIERRVKCSGLSSDEQAIAWQTLSILSRTNTPYVPTPKYTIETKQYYMKL